MKKKIGLLLLVVAAAAGKLLMPFQSSDVAQLVPVETLVVSMENGQVVLDSGENKGIGATWTAAVQDLRQSAAGKLFLGTAEQVVLCKNAEELLEDMITSEVLRPAAAVCLCPGEAPDAGEAGAYLKAQSKGVALREIHAKLLRGEAVNLPVLINTEGGFRIYAP